MFKLVFDERKRARTKWWFGKNNFIHWRPRKKPLESYRRDLLDLVRTHHGRLCGCERNGLVTWRTTGYAELIGKPLEQFCNQSVNLFERLTLRYQLDRETVTLII